MFSAAKNYIIKFLILYMDIVIPFGPNDKEIIHKMIEYTKKNIIDYNNIYIISYDPNFTIDGCIVIDESIFPFNKNSIFEYFMYCWNYPELPECEIEKIKNRTGWYLQQLIKLYAAKILGLENYLVIDCDTFFLKPTYFFYDGLPLYNTGDENHTPYFVHMKKLHPSLIKQNERSGICHHMVFQKHILDELFQLIETYHKKPFYEAFLSFVEYNSDFVSAASEYEIYFNYLHIYHYDKFLIRNLHWDNPNKLNLNSNHDYISYHSYSR